MRGQTGCADPCDKGQAAHAVILEEADDAAMAWRPGLPVPGGVLQLALGELATLMTTGQRVSPTKALAGGYQFEYPLLEPALRAILTKE